MIARLTPLKHSKIDDIEQAIIPKNEMKPGFKGSYVPIVLEPNEYAKNEQKLAVSVFYAGHRLGYLPELASVIEWKGEGHAWTKAVEAIRTQLFLEYDMNGTTRWGGHVFACRYISKANGFTRYCAYPEFSVMPPEEQKAWKLEQIAVDFPVEDLT